MRELARWLVKLMPEDYRDRYGREMLELLHDSTHPTQDLINLAAYVLRWNMEAAMREPILTVATLVAAASLFAGGYAVAELADGAMELHKHWWSTMPFLGLVLAAGLAMAARSQRHARYSPKST